MNISVLREYAKLISKVGATVQKGQEVFITAELDQPEFVAMLVDECYKLKAKKVVVDWSYQPLTKLHVRYRSLKTLSTLDNMKKPAGSTMLTPFPAASTSSARIPTVCAV